MKRSLRLSCGSDTFGWLLIGSVLLYAFYKLMLMTWPASLFLLPACGALWLVHARLSSPRERISSTAAAVWRAARNGLACLVIGLGAVCLTQLALRIFAEAGETESVLRAELWLSKFQRSLDQAMHMTPVRMVVLSVLLFALILYLPSLRLGHHFARVRRWGSRLLVVVYTLNTFSFFSARGIEDLEKEWVASWQHQAKESLRSLQESQNSMVASAILEQASRSAKPQQIAHYSTLYNAGTRSTRPELIRRKLAALLAQHVGLQSAGSMANDTASTQEEEREQEQRQQTDTSIRAVINRVQSWAKAPEQVQVTVRDIADCQQEALRVSERVRGVTVAAVTALSSLLAIEPHLATEMVEAFVQEFSKSKLGAELPPIRYASEARQWAANNVKVEEVFAPGWEFSHGSVGAKAAGGSHADQGALSEEADRWVQTHIREQEVKDAQEVERKAQQAQQAERRAQEVEQARESYRRAQEERSSHTHEEYPGRREGNSHEGGYRAAPHSFGGGRR